MPLGQLVAKPEFLGTQALGKPPSFDPRLDPIVRMQAGELRMRLARYYETEGTTIKVAHHPKSGDNHADKSR